MNLLLAADLVKPSPGLAIWTLVTFLIVFVLLRWKVWGPLMKMLEDDPSPHFDLCYLDGAHEWFTDGFAFVLVDRLLQPGGLIIFDDLDWTYETSPSLKNTERVRRMPADERSTQQVRKVYELLVKTHPDYGDFTERDGWGYARKRRSSSRQAVNELRTETVYEKEYIGLGAAILQIARRIAR